MGARGPKKRPTALAALHGNPSKRRLPTNEPQGQGDLWAPPGWFDDDQRAQWDYAVEHAPPGLLTGTDRETLERQVLEQARQQLGWRDIQAVLTVVEKRATFACRPGVKRPGLELGHGLWACGDYVSGPYPATLEGAVLSGTAVAACAAAG